MPKSIVSILLVEDDALTAQLYQKLLEGAGYNVLIAQDTATAAQIMRGIEVDLVLVDYELPDQIGIDWLRDMRTNPIYARISAILISSSPRDEDLRDDPFVWFMEKPMQPQHIIVAVQHTIARLGQ